ncbi:hypothetical protein BKA65DRAFT_505816 [Rhexocercosporidium sp. MPI-PUGE-AT-0058]|nr:hypothetical protein BKA65DRAFT_505816 [Rhexocercosporidium sp. MPI-PUGE-AT-0058]
MEAFTLFPLLPTELRLKIWECSIPQAKALLPRTYTADSCRAACRESRAIHLKTFKPFFTPSARSLFPHPISLYGNPALDDTLYLDDIYTLTKDFKEWIVPDRRGAIVHLAVQDEMWKMKYPRRRGAALEAGGDLRFMIFHPGAGLSGLEVLTLVLTGGVLVSGGNNVGNRDGQGKGDDERMLIECEEVFLEDKKVGGDVRDVLATLNRLNNMKLNHGWREPELRFARIVME